MISLRLLTLSFILSTPSFAQPAPTLSSAQYVQPNTPKNVILITWDGIRREEFLNHANSDLAPNDTAPTLPYLWNTLAPLGQLYGNPADKSTMTVSNTVMMSLPGYQSIMAGSPQPCFGNDCGRIRSTTFPERLVDEENFSAQSVAVFGSWEKIAEAATHRDGSFVVNAGLRTFEDPFGKDADLDAINSDLIMDPPQWEGGRYDAYTHKLAMRYLRHYQPRLLYISYGDSDEWGHLGNYPNYLSTIRRYDQWLQDTVATLQNMGDYGKNTCLIVTTDHGRGNGAKWTTHSDGVPESAFILMYAGCPLSQDVIFTPSHGKRVSHVDIRPTIENLLGVKPHSCALCGKSLIKNQQLAPNSLEQ